MSVNNQPIHALLTIAEITEQYPQTIPVFAQFGIHAQGYEALKHEDLSATCRVHQIALGDILNALNGAVVK